MQLLAERLRENNARGFVDDESGIHSGAILLKEGRKSISF
jgi:hypothetical protein